MITSPWRTTNVQEKINNCLQGFRDAVQERSVMYCAVLDGALCLHAHCTREGEVRGLYVAAAALPMMFELVNSAIERAVDHAGIEFSELAREAKDISAAASMAAHSLSIVLSSMY